MSQRLLICTDLDRTLIPNGEQSESPDARQHFEQLVAHDEVALAYVSGRDKKLVRDAMATYQLPLPDFVLADVGTSIYHVGAEQDWQRLTAWDEDIARDWHGLSHHDLSTMLQDIDELLLQEAAKQNANKLSYYVPLLHGQREALSSMIQQRLQAAGVNARQVWSVDDPTGVGLLDILPLRASKLHAIEALMQLHGFDHHNTVFCGDSGNDIEVLVSAIPAVLVANSTPDVRELALRLSDEQGYGQQLYIAQGDFQTMNGFYSAGMLEGIAHYYPYTIDWMNFTMEQKQL